MPRHVNQPDAGAILDKAGNLYGTIADGGDLSEVGCAVVFKLDHLAKKLSQSKGGRACFTIWSGD